MSRPPRLRGRPAARDTSLTNMVIGGAFVACVCVLATIAYVAAGWSLGDAFYMVILTVFTVGYGEVEPVDTTLLRTITTLLIVLGCSGMVFLTGAVVQALTARQFREILEGRRVRGTIDAMTGHVIICGYGRIGNLLARELHAARTPFVILERSEARASEAAAAGYLCVHGDAVEETSLEAVGITRARALATVLPDDAANVFITLSARSLNREIVIIARGESSSTERKLLHAGASRVVLPAHIGAERISEMLLFPTMGGERTADASVRRLGLALDMVIAEPGSAWIGLTAREIERRSQGAFLIVEVERAGTIRRERASDDTRIAAGDGVAVVGRNTGAAFAGFRES